MSGLVPQVILIVVLVVLNAAFAGTELALVSLREGQLQRLEKRSATGAALAKLARQPNQFLATIQIGITLAGFLASAAAAVSLSKPLERRLSFLGGASDTVAIIVVTLILSYVTLVFGELAPKRVAMQKAEKWGLVMARPLNLLTKLTRPAVWVLSKSSDLAVRMMGADPDRQREVVSEEVLREMVATQVTFTPEQRQIMEGAFKIAKRSLDEVLVPRSEVFVLDADWSCTEALKALVDSGHSRAPVAPRRNLDHVVGVVHMRQLLGGGDAQVSSIAVDVPVFPDAAKALTTLRELQARRAQMAIVANEHGGIEGVITIEDLIEELVGEIYDETDPDLATVERLGDGSFVLPGGFPMHDLNRVGIELPDGDYATIAGLILDRLGRIPTEPGDVVDVDGWRLAVRAVHRRRISEVHLCRLIEPATGAGEPLVEGLPAESSNGR